MVLTLYFGGGGFSIMTTELVLASFLHVYGPSAWQPGWDLLGAVGPVFFLLALQMVRECLNLRAGARSGLLRVSGFAMTPALTAHFLFGLGYVIYMTFLII